MKDGEDLTHERIPTLRSRWMIRFGLLSVVFLIFMGIGELATRWLVPQNLSGSWRIQSDRGVMYNKSGGTALHTFGEREVLYRFNEYHLRGAPVVPDVPSVLFLGDSHTFGWLLDEEDTYVSVLARLSMETFGPDRYQFLNGGAGGWGTADMLAYLEDKGPELKPSFVVVFQDMDDVRRAKSSGLYDRVSEMNLELKPLRKDRPASNFKQAINALPGYQWLMEHSHLVQLIRQTVIRLAVRPSSAVGGVQVDASDAVELVKAIYIRMKEWCDANNAQLLVVTTGIQNYSHREAKSRTGHWPVDAIFASEAEEFFANHRIPYRDVAPWVEAEIGDRLSDFKIPQEGHINETGAKLIAMHAWDFLRFHLAAKSQ